MTELVSLDIHQRGDVVVARLTGELDISVSARTGESISRSVSTAADGLVIDFSDLEFIDSSGVAMLFRLARLMQRRRQALRVVAPEGTAAARVLEIVDFARAAPIDQSLEEALSGIGRDGERLQHP